MTALTGIDVPPGSPGGSIELLNDLYLAPAPQAPVPADVFMLAGPGRAADPGYPGGQAAGRRPVLLPVAGKQLAGPGFWRYVARLAAAIRRHFSARDYTALHLQHLAFGATPALLRALPEHPKLALVHGTDLIFAADHPTQRAVLREAVAAADVVVVPTAAMGALLCRLCPVDPRRVEHIPWGVPDHLLAAPPPRRGPDPAGFRVLYAGRLTAEKGAESLLGACAGIEGVTLSVAAPVAEYRALARRTGLRGVRYLGWLPRPRLWRAFAEHDLLVVPSNRLEAFGLAAVEAQACGLPVLYQPVPGLVEVLGDAGVPADLAAGPGAVAAVLRGLRRDLTRDPAALADLRAAGFRNARRYPLSATRRALREATGRLGG